MLEKDLTTATSEPLLTELIEEYERSIGDVPTDIVEDDDVRLCRWEGQSKDGKKWTENLPDKREAFPFDGASDTRVPLADQVISDIADLLVTTLSRAEVKVVGVESQDAESAQAGTTLVNWLRKRMGASLLEEADLVANHQGGYGWSAVFVGWNQESSLKLQRLSMEEIVAMAQQVDPNSIVAELPMLIGNELAEDQASQLLMGVFPRLGSSEAKRVVRELRTEGASEFPVPFIVRNEPSIVSLKPVEDIVFPPETIDIQSARVVFRRTWMTEVELRAKVHDEEWNADFVEQAAKLKGKSSGHDEFSSTLGDEVIDRDNLVEIVHAYTRQIDRFGVPAIYYTILHPKIGDAYGKHEMLPYAHGKYPFVIFKLENVARRIVDSRSVPYVVKTWQNEIKAQRDSIHDWTSFSTIPSLQYLKRNGPVTRLGPAVQVPVTKIGDVQFMQPPSREPMVAFKVIQEVTTSTNLYYGLPDAQIPPTRTLAKQQRRVNSWLNRWGEVFTQAAKLCVQYMDIAEIERITNSKAAELLTVDGFKYDFGLSFNVEEMDNDLVKKRLETIGKMVVPLDAAGRIDRSKLIERLLRAITPEAADDLLVDQQGASQKVYEGVKQDLANMLLGFEATYADASNDPTAQMKLQYAQQLAQSNQKLMQIAQRDQGVQELMQKYLQNLQMAVQQQQNAQVGRIGVQPNSPQPAAQGV